MTAPALTYGQCADVMSRDLICANTATDTTTALYAFGAIRYFLLPKIVAEAAGTAFSFGGGPQINEKWRFTGAIYFPHAALTADDTNYATLSLEVNDGAGGASTTIASQTTKITGGSGNWAYSTTVAGTGVALTLSATVANLIVDGTAAAKYLFLKKVAAGTGVAIPVGQLVGIAQMTS